MVSPGTLASEIAEIPALVAALGRQAAPVLETAAAIRAFKPRVLVTIGRGSSDAVCEILGRIAGALLGLLPASLPPSLVTLHRAPLRWDGVLVIAVSQSGRSPDLVESVAAARRAGALTIAITNAPASPLAEACAHVIPIGAGTERSVAATKSVVLSLLQGLALIAETATPGAAAHALDGLPEALARALATDWARSVETLSAPSLVVVARGTAYGVAREAALKLKELAGIFAEAISGAEIMHGPKAALTAETPILAFVADDEAAASMHETLASLAQLTRRIVCLGSGPAIVRPIALPALAAPLFAPVLHLAAFYPLALALAQARGRSPDAPAHIQKVTLTR
jgi:glutamine---fructose-6-phosphate transaminase (isomerizing)